MKRRFLIILLALFLGCATIQTVPTKDMSQAEETVEYGNIFWDWIVYAIPAFFF